mmetsp:Transcript_33439/g.85439  ORF Transcript_33439/g.85439 Transcript_33439/m.85439 type:complete len:289 (+) Transcript_33439:356-1222(+)
MGSILIARKPSGPLLPVTEMHGGTPKSNCMSMQRQYFNNRKDETTANEWVYYVLIAVAAGALITYLAITYTGDKVSVQPPNSAGSEWGSGIHQGPSNFGVVKVPGVVPRPRTDVFSGIFKMLATDIYGHPRILSEFGGKVTMVVNVASNCGYTESNYRGLRYLQDKYRNLGFEILAFPSNQFQQEPGTNDEILKFAKSRFGASFTLFEKADVNGKGTHPVYKFLKRELPVEAGGQGEDLQLSWNFQKFLVNRSGHPVSLHGAQFDFGKLEAEIQQLLSEDRPELTTMR